MGNTHTFLVLPCVWEGFGIFPVFSCDEQLKKGRCHSVRPFVRSCFRLSPFFSFSVLEVSSSAKEFQWCFKAV